MNLPTLPISGRRPAGIRRGFSLVELLVVMSVIALLSSLVVPMMSGSNQSASLRQGLAAMSGLLEQARQTAVTKNTYVYVGIRNAADAPTGSDALSYAAAFVSTDGSDVLGAAGSADETSGAVRLLNRVQSFRGLDFSHALAASNALSGTLRPPAASPPSRDWELTTRSLMEFNNVIKFTPQGGARVEQVPVEAVELVVSPMRQGTVSSTDELRASVIRISGLTGKISVYQP